MNLTVASNTQNPLTRLERQPAARRSQARQPWGSKKAQHSKRGAASSASAALKRQQARRRSLWIIQKKCCTCHDNLNDRITNCCACHENCKDRITKCCISSSTIWRPSWLNCFATFFNLARRSLLLLHFTSSALTALRAAFNSARSRCSTSSRGYRVEVCNSGHLWVTFPFASEESTFSFSFMYSALAR